MNKFTKSMAASAAAAVLVVAGVACGSDDAADDDTTTTTEAAGSADAGGSEFSAEVEERGEPTVEAAEVPTELVIIDDVEGSGAEVTAGSTVTAHYVGAAASTGEVFESSWTTGSPATFPLDQVIQGWSEGLVGMKEGGRRTLVIPAEMAYGNGGPAPGDALVFTVDLVSVS